MEYLKKIGQKFGYSIFVQMSQTVCENVILSVLSRKSEYRWKVRNGREGQKERKRTKKKWKKRKCKEGSKIRRRKKEKIKEKIKEEEIFRKIFTNIISLETFPKMLPKEEAPNNEGSNKPFAGHSLLSQRRS